MPPLFQFLKTSLDFILSIRNHYGIFKLMFYWLPFPPTVPTLCYLQFLLPFVSSFPGLFFFFIAHLSVCLPQYLFYPFFVSFLLLRFYPWLHNRHTYVYVMHMFISIRWRLGSLYERECAVYAFLGLSLLIYFPNRSVRTSFEILSHPIRAVSSRNVATDAIEDMGEEKP